MGGRLRFAATNLLIGICVAVGLAAPARANEHWRPIKPADLALKDNPASPGAQAMILYREEFTDSMNSYITEYYRIKIFTAEGKKYGDIQIPFDKGVSSIHDIKARTVLPSGKVIEFKVKPFQKVVVKGNGVKVLADTFSFPDLKPGCIIEYKYRQQYDSDYYYDITWEVQDMHLFTREELFTIRPPSGPNAPGLFSRTIGLDHPVHPVKQKDGTYALILHNIPPLKHEPYMMPAELLQGRIEFFFQLKRLEKSTKFWNDQAKSWAKDENRFLNKKKTLRKVVAQTISPSDSPMAKLRKLYARAQQIHNTDFYDFGPPPAHSKKLKDNNNVKDVLKHGYGSGGDINALFVGLARAAGFDAHKVLFAGRQVGVFRPGAEDTQELNGDVVLVHVGGKNLFLDPGSVDYPFGLLTWDETGIEGLEVSKEGGTIVPIPSTKATQALTERHADLHLTPSGALAGKLEIDFKGIRGARIREAERGEAQSDRRKDLSKLIKPWLPSGASFHITSVTGWRHSAVPLRVEGTLKDSGYGTALGKRLLVPLVPFVSPEAGAFHSATRVNAVYFGYPFSHHDDITLHLPAGYSVESLPKLPAVNSSAFVYTVAAAKQDNTLHVTRDLSVLGFYFPVKDYPGVRSFFSTVKTGDDDQAVLETSVATASR
jgi:hypothetical protein